MKNYLGEIITASVTGVLGLLAWFSERKKRNQEVKANENLNQKSVVDLYQEALDDLKKRYDAKFEELEADLKKLRQNVNLWKGKYASLKEEFDKYRAAHK